MKEHSILEYLKNLNTSMKYIDFIEFLTNITDLLLDRQKKQMIQTNIQVQMEVINFPIYRYKEFSSKKTNLNL